MSQRYDIFNPTQARRVIFDGIEGQQHKIQVNPGETKRGVELEDHIAARFGDGRDGQRHDLWVTYANPELADPFSFIRPPRAREVDGPEYCPHCGKDIHSAPMSVRDEELLQPPPTEVELEPMTEMTETVAPHATTLEASASLPGEYERYQAPPIFSERQEQPRKKRAYKKRKKGKKPRRAAAEAEPEPEPGELDAA